jgi:small-conductance mechanosensitive channel
VGIAKVEVVRADQLWHFMNRAARFTRGIVVTVLAYAFVYFALSLFPWTRWIAMNLGEWIMGPLLSIGGGLVANVPNVIFLAILFLVTRWVLRFMKLFFDRVEKGHVQLEGFFPEWAVPTYKLARVGVIVFAVVVAFPYIPGSNSLAFKGITVFLGVLLSLGSSSAISNVIAGYTLVYRRAFKVGDRVRIGEVLGEVSQIRLQVTHVRTYKNEDVVLPNSAILGQEVTNYTTLARSRGLILHTTVRIGYGTPWRKVEAMLLLAASRTGGLLPEPAPFVLQLSLGEFAVAYEINVACDDTRAVAQLYSALHRNILDVFNEHDVQIMTPAYEGDPDQAKVVPKDRWYEAPARGDATGPEPGPKRA